MRLRPMVSRSRYIPTGKQHIAHAEDRLEGLAAQARSLTAWVSIAAAVTGFLIGPLCLLLLRHMLARMRGIGSALIRLARNDTSVEIPGVGDQDEFGELARSVAVFKAKSIELLNKKADFERLNLQLDAAINNMPLGLSMFDAQERLLMCNRQFTRNVRRADELTRPGTAHCALWEYRAKKGARHSETGELHRRGHKPFAIHARRIRRRPHCRGVAAASQRRRLGIAARGHYGAAQAGGADRPPRTPRCA